jgi:predicted dehydrogenase
MTRERTGTEPSLTVPTAPSAPPAPATTVPDYRPRFPDGPLPGVAVLGCGRIAQTAHLPAYAAYGLDVVGVWSRSPSTTAGVPERFGHVGEVYPTAEALLADPRVDVVDVATGPVDRLRWIDAALDAGKHVLAQKPLTLDVDALVPLLAKADRLGLRVAVNQNGRWAPPWRLATLLVADGAIGDVVGVTHLHDKPLPPIAGTPFDDVPHMLVTDYLLHWLDITRCWLEGSDVESVQARDTRVPGQPASARNPWSASVLVQCAQGATASLRVVGDVRTRQGSCPFWVHGTQGTLRGSVLLGSDRLTLERGDTTTSFALDGQWFVDGFAGAMGDLLRAVVEGHEPESSAAHNVGTLRLLLAARDSAAAGGAVVPTPGLHLDAARRTS